MALEVKRKQRESIQNLVKRFTQRMRQSGILIQARKGRFYEPPKNQLAKKKAALRREQLKKEYEKMKKLGK